MADLNDALERLISDPAFRQALGDDPDTALEGYDLSEDDRKMLSAQLSDDPGVRGGLEQRTSKSALAGLFGGGGSGESDLEFLGQHAEHGNSEPPTEEISFVYQNITFDDEEDPKLAFNPKEFPVSKTNPSPPLPGGGDHEIEMDVHVGLSEPEPPSDLSAGAEAGGQDHSGKYVVSSVQHGAAPGFDGDESLGSSPEEAPGGERGDMPIESMSLNYEEIKIEDAAASLAAASSQPGTEAPSDLSAGEGTDEASFKELTISKKTDTAALDPDAGTAGVGRNLVADGSEDPAANAFLKLGDVPPPQSEESDYLEIEMKPVFVTSYQTGPSGDAAAEGAAAAEESSGATSSKPKEIVVVGSPPPPPPAGGENSSNWIRVKGDWGEPDQPSDIAAGEAEIEDGTSKTAIVSESQSGSDGDPLVGKITPKGETEQGSPTLQEVVVSGRHSPGSEPEQPVVTAVETDDDSRAGAVNEKWLRDRYPVSAEGDPDQPIVAGTLYNPPGAQAGSSAPDDIPISDPSYPASSGAGLRSDGELVQDEDTGPGNLAPTGRGVEEGIEGTDVSTGYTSEPGDIGDDLPDDPPED